MESVQLRQPGGVSGLNSVKGSGTVKEHLGGWRRSLALGVLMSIVVLLFNIAFTGYAVDHHRVHSGRGVLYEGNCETVKGANIAFHLIINILSTVLLGASNFCMQCLCAPTRKDIDRAHRSTKWLDIGVPSTRNLFQISRKRSWLWICLVVSSVPLHLMYNSTIFSSIGANSYNVYAGKGLLNQTALTSLDGGLQSDAVFLRLYSKAQNETLYRLDNSACVDAYATAYQSRYGSLIVVTDNITSPHVYPLAATQDVYNPAYEPVPGASGYNWICQDLESHKYEWELTPCTTNMRQVREQIASNKWTVAGYPVEYCLAEELPAHCKLQYSLPLVLIVIAFNIVKAVVLGYVAVTTADTPLLTTGDAVASFLATPDDFSHGLGLIPADAIRRPAKYSTMPTFDGRPKRWRSAISRRRWRLGLGVYSTALLACVALLAYGLMFTSSPSAVWSVSLGEVATQSILSADQYWIPSVVINAILANLPQLIFSGLYFAVNAMATTVALAHEWSQYAVQRKGLRVSSRPIGAQRSSYFLSLPYRYAVPLIVLSVLVHWLISQSLFLVMVEAYSPTLHRQPDFDVTSCGYSPVAIVATIAVGTVMLITLVGLSYRRFRSGMPVAGSCSVAIAAACHPNLGHEVDGSQASLPLQWGVVEVGVGVKRCAFSSADVDMPEQGLVYQ